MATNGPRSEDTIDDVMTCPVCTNDFTDPRLLACGHHFCFGCLAKIAQGQDEGSIPCPTCRHITEGKPEGLKKIVLNNFQANVSLFLNKQDTRTDKLCGLCDKSTPATATCRECQVHFCESCRKNHETLEKISKHKITSISDVQFCREHRKNFTQCLCKTCDQFLCLWCVIKHDKAHTLVDIKEAAEKAKLRLNKFVSNKESVKKDNELSGYVTDAIKKLQDKRDIMNKDIAKIEGNISSLRDKLRSVKEEMDEAFQKELKELELLIHDTSEFINSKESLIQHVKELLDTGSDCEIIRQEKEFPKCASDSVRSAFNTFYFKMPNVENLGNLAYEIKTLVNDIQLNQVLTPIIKEERLQPIRLCTSFSTCVGSVEGLAYDSNNDTYVVRSNNAEKLIQVYDTSGRVVRTLGSEKKGLTECVGLAIDTRRKLYLLPTANGKIVTMDYGGKEKVIDVTRYKLFSISYCSTSRYRADRYFVTSASFSGDIEEASDTVFIVDPERGTIIREIKKERCTSSPYSVTSFGTAECALFAVGYYIGGISVFEFRGNRICVKEGNSGTKLSVGCVCADIGSGIIVYEEANDAILSYSYNTNKRVLDSDRILFSVSDMKEKEHCFKRLDLMVLDWKKRRLLGTCYGTTTRGTDGTGKVFLFGEQ